MKYIILITIFLAIIMFFSITTQAKNCKNSGGEYIQTERGGICIDKSVIK